MSDWNIFINMSNFNRFTLNIRPSSLVEFKEVQDFYEMMDYFDRDVELFLETKDDNVELIYNWYVIANKITKLGKIFELNNKLHLYKRMRNNKIIILDTYLESVWTDFRLKRSKIINEFEKNIKMRLEFINIYDLDQKQQYYYDIFLKKNKKNYLEFLSILQGLISVIFFAFESSSKIISSLGCYEFAESIANNEIIQHNRIWQTLKRIAKVETGTRCNNCDLKSHCYFKIDFFSLANAYCYAIKTRMLSDYSELFYKLFSQIKKSMSKDINYIHKYFLNIQKIIKGQRNIETSCLGW